MTSPSCPYTDLHETKLYSYQQQQQQLSLPSISPSSPTDIRSVHRSPALPPPAAMSLLPRAAFRASRVLQASASSTSPTATTQSDAARAHDESKAHQEGKQELKKGAKRDPELIVLGGVVTFALGFSGWYFGAKPTTASSEQAVSAIAGSEPWHSGTSGKYQYHSRASKGVPKDAPSALHSVTIPDVNLPKKLHDTFNKYDKEEFDDY